MNAPGDCAGKVPFLTFGEARRQASKLARKRSGPLSAYHCQTCGRFHVGSRPGAMHTRRPRNHEPDA